MALLILPGLWRDQHQQSSSGPLEGMSFDAKGR